MKRLFWLLPALFILFYFFHFTHWGLRADFTHDDLMNMWRSLERSWPDLLKDNVLFWRPSPTYRPFGALVYKVSLDQFGLSLFPLRVFCFLVLVLNIFLVYALGRRLSGSREIGALAALLHAYHGNFSALYCSSGMLYDIFCFSFAVGTILVYLKLREETAGQSKPLRLALALILLILALDSKEMALAMPLLLGAYELTYHFPGIGAGRPFWKWLMKAAPAPAMTAVICLVFYAGRIAGADGLTQIGGYRVSIGLAEYLQHTGHYLDELFYQVGWFTPLRTAALLLILVVIASLLRSRLMIFSAFFFIFGILPIAFIPDRSLHAAYLPVCGLAIYAAALLVLLRDALWSRGKRLVGYRDGQQGALHGLSPASVLLFALVASSSQTVHPTAQAAFQSWRQGEYIPIRSMMDQMAQLHPVMPKGAKVLVVKDPFGEYIWADQFIMSLIYREPYLIVGRLPSMKQKPEVAEIENYTVRLSYEDGKLRDLCAAEVPLEK